MANSKYEYVRSFEQADILLPNTFIVVRIDGRGFTKFTTKYKFVKPNDRRALDLMNAAAEAVMKDLPDLVLAYGQSDEFSFVFHKDCMLFERRASKLTTTIVSTFTANYVLGWSKYFPDTPLTPPLPSFDGRAVCYPSDTNLRDYLSWRQVDCHINNLYNTSFWALVQQGGMDPRAAEQELSGTFSADKNEILFSRFGINYNNEPEIFKKGSVLYRDFFPTSTQSSPTFSKTKQSSTPPLSQPKPKRIARPMSQPLGRSTYPDLLRDSPTNTLSTASTPRGPTFLSTSTTPSPPPSPPSIATTRNGPGPIPQRTTSTTTRPSKPVSHSAHASLSTTRPTTAAASTKKPTPKRSPSMSVLDFAPPQIPLRISSIPLNAQPRKLSLPSQKSYSMLKAEEKEKEKENAILHSTINGLQGGTGQRKSPPPHLKTMKELPSPPIDDVATRHAVMGSSPPQWSTSPPPPPTRHSHSHSHSHFQSQSQPDATTAMDKFIVNPVIPSTSPLPPPRSRQRGCSHSRLNSAPLPSTTSGAAFMALGSHPPTVGNSNTYSTANASAYDSEKDREREKRERDDRIRFAHFDWSPTLLSPLNPFDGDQTPAEPGSGSGSNSTDVHAISPPGLGLTHAMSSPKPKPKPQLLDATSTTSTTPLVTANPSRPTKPRPKDTSQKGKSKSKAPLEDGHWAAPTKSDEGGGAGRSTPMSKTQREKDKKKRLKAKVVVEHVDLIKDGFWERRPWILSGRVG
ncbi:Thg1-domain-containing protein [Lentithecium fluviatile CBS 122367]|uniref:tRNA(His) guanylyltransferase n=1 Tax=Lentithecium fluviatile CBS 122367 TaxID=1168545 RepID=A0A6G1IHS7_9PLEO|nr:Thg1-domain-containing protein [Lentithecium fluviatile CBS 122367]